MRSREEAVRRYLVYIFGEIVPDAMRPQIQKVRDAFNEGWDYAATAERELDHLAIQVLSKERYKRRRGCF